MEKKDNIKILAQNKKARHDYFIEDTYEAGIELFGTEVKSVRMGRLNLKDSFASVSKQGEIFVHGMHISPYEMGNIFNREPLRERRLLLHKSEIRKINAAAMQLGYSIIPLSVYLKGSRVKMELAVCKGKKLYDKRDDAKARDAKRNIDRALREQNR